jgi:hypothetical protein
MAGSLIPLQLSSKSTGPTKGGLSVLAKIRFFAATLLVLLPLKHSASAATGFKPVQSYTVGTAPRAVAVADFNNDGNLDAAVASIGDPSNGDDGGVSILMGNGDGSFQPATTVAAGTNPLYIATADFNGDGNCDLIVVRWGDPTVGDNGGATIFLGKGDGTFSKGQVLAAGRNPFGVTLGDVNADHKLDLIFPNSTDDSVTVSLGNGDATFQSPVAYVVESSPRSVSLIDLNQDGKSDLAVFMFGSVNFFLGNGDGTFQKGPSVFAGTLRSFSTIGDFNRDGKLDLVDGGCSIFKPVTCDSSLRLGNGDGTFQPANGAPGVSGAVAADVNGDGNLDLVGSNSDRTRLTVLLGNGDGTFQQPATFSAGTNANPTIGVVADLDGDKAPDLIALDSTSNLISVLLNTGTDFSISASALSPSTVSGGQSATSTVSLKLMNAFDNPVSLACAITPAQAGTPTCSLSSESVTFDAAGNASSTLTITSGSAAASVVMPSATRAGLKPFSFGWLPVAGFAFMGITLIFLCPQRRKGEFFAGTLLIAALLSLLSCGGGSSSTPPVNYAITIKAISGSTQRSTAVTLTVQ